RPMIRPMLPRHRRFYRRRVLAFFRRWLGMTPRALLGFSRALARTPLPGVLVSLVCLAMLVAVVLPPLGSYPRPRAKAAACQSNLRQLGMALNLYVDDWGRLPPASGWQDALRSRVDSDQVFLC